MTVGSTIEALAAFFKEQYDGGEVPRMLRQENVFLDLIGTDERGSGTGDILIAPFIDQDPQGLASTRAGAQAAAQTANGGNISGAAWQVPWGDYKGSVYIGHKALSLSKDRMGAFFQDKKEEMDGVIRTFGRVFESLLLGDSGHSVTPGTFTISTGVCTLADPQDIVHIEKGMLLQASADNGTSTSHALLGSGSIGYVYLVNYNAGTFTVATSDALAVANTAGTPSGWTSTMYAFRNTDFGGTSTPNLICDTYGSYCPAADPADTFRGVVRTLDPMRRGGVRLTATNVLGKSLEDRIKMLCVKMSSRGGYPATKVLIHDEQWLALANSLESRGQRPIDGKAGIFSFPKLQLATPKGMVDVFATNKISVNVAYAFDPKHLHFRTATGFPEEMQGDGNILVRKSDEDTYEFRILTIPAYYHRIPAAAGRVPLLDP